MTSHQPFLDKVEALAQTVWAEIVVQSNTTRKQPDARIAAAPGDHSNSDCSSTTDGCGTVEVLLGEVLRRLYSKHGNGERASGASDDVLSSPAQLPPTTSPFALKGVPTLASVADRQMRLTTRVMCAVATRPVVTVHELEQEICVDEGVACFADLGFGRHLQSLPIVQQYFQVTSHMDVLPVSSCQVLAFLLSREGEYPSYIPSSRASSREHQTGSFDDTRSLMNAFRAFYEHTYLPHVRESRGLPKVHISNNRQLGIHIQSLPWLLSSLRQAAAVRQERLDATLQQASVTFARNEKLYVEVIRALDQKLLQTSVGGPFSVRMSEQEARATSIPLSCWTTTGRDSDVETDGGVKLQLCVGNMAPTKTASATSQNTLPGVTGGVRATPDTSVETSLHSPAVAHVAARRRRGGAGGTIISDGSTAVAVSATASFVPHAIPPPPPHMERETTVLADTQTSPTLNKAPPKSPMERLHLFVRGKEELTPFSLISDVLAKLVVGQLVSKKLLTQVFDQLVASVADGTKHRLLADVSGVAFLPVPHPERSATSKETFEIVALARPVDICWDPAFLPALASAPRDVQECTSTFLTVFSLESLAYLSDSAVRLLSSDGGSEGNTRAAAQAGAVLAPWVFNCDVLRRITDMRTLSDVGAFTTQYLKSLSFYLAFQFAQFGSEREHRAGRPVALADALRDFVTGVESYAGAIDFAQRRVFPLERSWWRTADGLFVGEDKHFGYRDCLLQPQGQPVPPGQRAPALPVMHCETRDMSFLTKAVLCALGVQPLDNCISRRVCFDSLRHSDTSLLLHKAVVLVTPLVQGYLSRAAPQLFDAAYDTLCDQLQRFRVVLGKSATLTETVMPTSIHIADLSNVPSAGTLYASSRSVRLTYVATHATLYGEDADCSPAVVAEALCDLFLPWSPRRANEDVRNTLQCLLECLLQTFFSHVDTSSLSEHGQPLSYGADTSFTHVLLSQHEGTSAAERQVVSALRAAAEAFGRDAKLPFSIPGVSTEGTPSSVALLSTRSRLPLPVSSVPPLKRQMHFPPGCDGLSAPSCRHVGGTIGQPSGGRVCMGAATDRTATSDSHTTTAGLSDAAVMRASSHLPQWDTDFYSAVSRDALAQALETLRCRQHPDPFNRREDGDQGGSSAEDDDDDNGTQRFVKRPRAEIHKGPTTCSVETQDERDATFLSTRPRTFVSADGTSTANDTTAAAIAAERFVYDNLQARCREENAEAEHHGRQDRIHTIWLNEATERGTAYDLVLVRTRGPTRNAHSGGGGTSAVDLASGNAEVVEYIEVKSTTTNDRRDFEISIRELLLAARYGRSYKIYRVYGASTSPMRKMRFRIYDDILRLWYTGKLTLTGSIHATPSF